MALAGPDDEPMIAIATEPELTPQIAGAADATSPFETMLLERRDKAIQKQLEQLIDFDEQHAAAILSQRGERR